MTEPGKHAPGLKGFPTPNEAADIASYLLLLFPDQEWAQYALGALKILTVGYNWYQAGDLDVEDAAEAFRLIVQQAPLNKLPSCSLPTGEPLMRIHPSTGHIQNVDEDGNWQDDPSLPPTPERPPDDPDIQRCLGAANAAYALSVLYESLSDSFNGGLSTAEAITAFVATVGTAIAVEFFPPAAALIAIGGLLFEVVYAVVAFVGADVWTEDFTAKLQCMLYDCSSVTDNVVTFDFECVINALAAQTNVFDLSFVQLRLFGQLYYILGFIGSDGLNYGAAATIITDAECLCSWCIRWDFENDCDLLGLTLVYGTCDPDGYVGQFLDVNSRSAVYLEAGSLGSITFTSITVRYSFSGSGPNRRAGFQLYAGGSNVLNHVGGPDGSHVIENWTGHQVADYINFQLNSGLDGTPAKLEYAEVRGFGTKPAIGEDCP